MGICEALLKAVCTCTRDSTFGGKRLLLLQSTAGLRPAGSAVGEGAFPLKSLFQSQELPFLPQLLAEPHSSSHLSTSRRHMLLLCFSTPETCMRKHAEMKALGCCERAIRAV